MKTYQFKTNIHCEGCIAKITPYLQQIKSIESWEVDLKNPEKVLTVQAPENTKVGTININELVTDKIREAGYQIEALR